MAFKPYPDDFANLVREIYLHWDRQNFSYNKEDVEKYLRGLEYGNGSLREVLESAMNPGSYGIGPQRLLNLTNGIPNPEAHDVLRTCAQAEVLHQELLGIYKARSEEPFDMSESVAK